MNTEEPEPRRPPQFSLWTALIVTTAGAVVCAVLSALGAWSAALMAGAFILWIVTGALPLVFWAWVAKKWSHTAGGALAMVCLGVLLVIAMPTWLLVLLGTAMGMADWLKATPGP
jgi:hypothetical protein